MAKNNCPINHLEGTCSACGKTINKKKPYMTINRDVERYNEEKKLIDIYDSYVLLEFCNLECYLKENWRGKI